MINHVFRASKTTILFVVRDYVGVTPIEALEDVLSEEIDKIWSSIDKVTPYRALFQFLTCHIFKPQSLQNSQFGDVFTLRFAFLPHKIFKTDEFLAAIDSLRERYN